MLTTAQPQTGRYQGSPATPWANAVIAIVLVALLCAAFLSFVIATLQFPTTAPAPIPNFEDDGRTAAESASRPARSSSATMSPSVVRVTGFEPATGRDVDEPASPPPALDIGLDQTLRVALWGDSLAFEARDHFVEAFGDADMATAVDTYTLGGTAICDFLDHMEASLASGSYDAVVLAFSGNALTSCMKTTDGTRYTGAAHTAAYTLHLQSAIRRARGTPLFLAVAPPSKTDSAEAVALRAMYQRRAAAISTVHLVDTGDALLDEGMWTPTLSCLPFEDEAFGCVDGQIDVRAPDGAHFCPESGPAIEGVTGTCRRWSSGAYRFGRALAQPILDSLQQTTVVSAGDR